MQCAKELFLEFFRSIWVRGYLNIQYPIALPGVGGWFYFKPNLKICTVEELQLIPTQKWARFCLGVWIFIFVYQKDRYTLKCYLGVYHKEYDDYISSKRSGGGIIFPYGSENPHFIVLATPRTSWALG